ncbi:MAG: sulfate adenylyltransferase, partial [Thermoanaerobaculales bacterium]|nr:sulfate adenylyltransferase [Thermoanaerobaculales bacterium]
TADFELLANGGFAPLKGFMGSEDWKSTVENMTLADGQEVWPIPVVLATDLECEVGDVVGLSAPNGKALGRLTVEEIYEKDVEHEAETVYRTTDVAHPGVAATKEEGNRCIAGEIEADDMPDHEEAFMRRYFTPEQSRKEFADRGWKRIVAFQTRNPIHRAHEYLTKAALEVCDGLFLHPLIGETKSGDIPADVRMKCYEVLMENYYPNDRVVLGVNPAAMRYAGPREAIFHAVVRRNYGATHFIVGRDHAGVGDYYGTYDAQYIFNEFDPAALDITPMMFEHSFFCTRCGNMASQKTCPHGNEDHVFLSGTKVRAMLENGEAQKDAIRPGNIHSANGTLDLIKPIVIRYRKKFKTVLATG